MSALIDFKFAYRLGVTQLYEYRCYNSPKQREFVRQTQVKHRVNLARARELNG